MSAQPNAGRERVDAATCGAATGTGASEMVASFGNVEPFTRERNESVLEA
ncbi:MAG: hypothetical protein QOE16_258, partial [Microbacteriaceae bacterium]|nr:hypothetical protein [Microbacteriaceae bacterium]